MQKELIKVPGFTVIGLKIRTNNANEMNPATAKIGALVGQYFSQNIAEQIKHRKNPGVTIDGFTNYASDEFGDYDYFIGEVVTNDAAQAGFELTQVPAGQYVKFTTPKGPRVSVIIETWQKIWKMTPDDLGGKRTYQVDYEVYDQRAMDPENTIVDICIGIK